MRLLTIVCGLSGGFAYASLAEKETQYLDNIEGKIQAYVVFSTDWAHNFLDIKNNESYVKHINRYKDSFVLFEHEVLGSLRAEKKSTDNSEYGQAISLTHEIVSTLYDQAKHVHTILEKHRKNPNAIFLGKDLQAVEKYTKPDVIAGLQSKLRRLQGIFSKIYQSLATKIGVIIDSLERRKAKKLNMVDSWKALSHRVNCKN